MPLVKQTLLFPLAAAINFFSVTALLIIAGLLGKGNLAADIAIIQGAVVAVFLSLSGNARSLILSRHSENIEKSLFYFRLLLMLPAIFAAYFLANSFIDLSSYLIIGLILRKCSEWIAELQLANREKQGDFNYAIRYLQLNLIGFLVLSLMLLIPSWGRYFNISLLIWAILPVMYTGPYILSIIVPKKLRVGFYQLIPHIGSTTVIGISMYIFRILIVILAGKLLAGQMFTAYALGGVISSLYTYAIGPSLMLKKPGNQKALYSIMLLCIILGGLVIFSTFFWEVAFYSPLFIQGIGYSLAGGGVMLLAQHHRLYILQICKKEVFVPDVLINILLIAIVPFAYYLFGETSFAYFFLWSALLNLLFYKSLASKISLGDA